MDEVEILPVVTHPLPDRQRCIVMDRLDQFALVGRCKDGHGEECTWIDEELVGVEPGDRLAVISKPWNAQVLGKVV